MDAIGYTIIGAAIVVFGLALAYYSIRRNAPDPEIQQEIDEHLS